ncbi:hypothetical protein [Rhizobium sp. 12,4]|uniref:HNH endonuclease signature motif containing protein n=1 Tax=Rhizobium sp. 12,4 TaxID=3405135 RepID=UPI003D328F8A
MKRCSKCGVEKDESEFNPDKRLICGLRADCRECEKAARKTYRANNKEKLKAANAKWYDENKEYAKQKQKEYREENREWFAERNRQWVAANPDKKKASDKAWREGNPERRKANLAEWGARNPERRRELNLIAQRKRLSTPKGRLESNIRGSLRRGLRGGKSGRRTFEVLGYTSEQLKLHLEKQFVPGMTWDNYGSAWHVDHIIPLAAFNYETVDDIDFGRAWALSNLQPLWATDNVSKGDKLEKPFQPSLSLAIRPTAAP